MQNAVRPDIPYGLNTSAALDVGKGFCLVIVATSTAGHTAIAGNSARAQLTSGALTTPLSTLNTGQKNKIASELAARAIPSTCLSGSTTFGDLIYCVGQFLDPNFNLSATNVWDGP